MAELITHALEDDPNECCGLILGQNNSATAVRRVTNNDVNKLNRYTMDPLEVMKVEREADALAQELIAIYHSHTYTQAYPSETDIRRAVESGWADRIYILVSLVEKSRPVVRAFWISQSGEVFERFIQSS